MFVSREEEREREGEGGIDKGGKKRTHGVLELKERRREEGGVKSNVLFLFEAPNVYFLLIHLGESDFSTRNYHSFVAI